jgi:hypothetical protein
MVQTQRTGRSVLKTTGPCRVRQFVNCHHMLHHAAFSWRATACVLLGLLLDANAPIRPILLGPGDTAVPLDEEHSDLQVKTQRASHQDSPAVQRRQWGAHARPGLSGHGQ